MATTDSPRQAYMILMFVDVCGSTRLYETLGDERAQAMINGLLTAIRRAVEDSGGTVVKEIGDESMIVFDSIHSALSLARELPGLQQDHQLSCKTGIHGGNALLRDGDVFGDAVNTAARIVGLATPGQVLISQSSLDRMPESDRPNTRNLPPMSARGKSGMLMLVELAEDLEADYTQEFSPATIANLRLSLAQKLSIKWHAGSMRLDAGHEGIVIGREADCDVVLALPHVSRRHLRIESHGDHWLVHDQSTNGTLVCEQGSESLILRRERHRLVKAGTLHLVPSKPDLPTAIVEYRIDHG